MRTEMLSIKNWREEMSPTLQQSAVTALEQDKILVLPELSFALNENEKKLLLENYNDLKAKNISYDVRNYSLRGIAEDAKTRKDMVTMLNRFSESAYTLVCQLFPAYRTSLRIGQTSYRPLETAHRKAKSYKKDDRRLHVDAFASNPMHGSRILRVFCNINPDNKPRVWRVGEPFKTVAEKFLPKVSKQIWPSKLLIMLNIIKRVRTPYDHIMLKIHDRMKQDKHYQQNVAYTEIAFPANSTWITQTDSVSHAVISGQFVLEQTFYLPVSAMVNENASPLRILEAMKQKKLV